MLMTLHRGSRSSSGLIVISLRRYASLELRDGYGLA
jgi:hypothetical protein